MAAASGLLRCACGASWRRFVFSPVPLSCVNSVRTNHRLSFHSSLLKGLHTVQSLAATQTTLHRNFSSNKDEYEKLWAAATGGRGTGRGRKKKVKKGVDPEKLTFARGGLKWEGFNVPVVLEGDSKVKKQFPAREENERDRQRSSQWFQRGWSGTTWPGKKVGHPQRSDGEMLTSFDSVVIELRRVSNVTSGGKKRSLRALVVVGNRNGAAGFGVGKGKSPISAIRKARNKAANYLYFVERCDDRTIFHNLETQHKKTKIIFQRKPQGFGLSCHRAIKEIAELLGIDDMRCKVIGPSTPLSLVQAVFQGLTSQTYMYHERIWGGWREHDSMGRPKETHQELADRTGLNVVELRQECGMRPIVVATPSDKAAREALKKRVERDDYDLHEIFDPHKGLHRPKKRSELL